MQLLVLRAQRKLTLCRRHIMFKISQKLLRLPAPALYIMAAVLVQVVRLWNSAPGVLELCGSSGGPASVRKGASADWISPSCFWLCHELMISCICAQPHCKHLGYLLHRRFTRMYFMARMSLLTYGCIHCYTYNGTSKDDSESFPRKSLLHFWSLISDHWILINYDRRTGDA